MSKSTKNVATAAQVRDWALSEGLPVKAGRGRLPLSVIGAFNEAHPKGKFPGRSKSTAKVVKVTLKAKPAKGRTKTRKATTAEVRAFAVANGLAKNTRGRLSAEAKRAFVLGVNAE